MSPTCPCLQLLESDLLFLQRKASYIRRGRRLGDRNPPPPLSANVREVLNSKMHDVDSATRSLIDTTGVEIEVQRAPKGTVQIHGRLNGEVTRKASLQKRAVCLSVSVLSRAGICFCVCCVR